MAQLSDEDFMRVRAIAPFELAAIFEEWRRRAHDMPVGDVDKTTSLDGLGPPWCCLRESFEDYGRRIAAGIITLLKEV